MPLDDKNQEWQQRKKFLIFLQGTHLKKNNNKKKNQVFKLMTPYFLKDKKE